METKETKEIILRTYTNNFFLLKKLKTLLENETDFKVSVVDHSNLSRDDFDIDDSDTLISIDRFIAIKLQIPYYRISRVFDYSGNVLSRFEEGFISKTGPHIKILDSDMVEGNTIRYACNKFNTSKYSVPLVLDKHQDLIDIEDLIFANSLFATDEKAITNLNYKYHMRNDSYCINEEVFSKRTSLPKSLYSKVTKLIYNY